MIKSLYIHIPFCDKICSYCDFCKILYNKKFISKYLDSLEKEINDNYNNDILDTIYIGGGTPSSLDLDELERLFKIISKLKTSNNLEYTIEGNFNNTSYEKLNLYKKYGINRLSFGVESINSNNLKLLGRSESKNRIIDIINYSKSIGFNNINVDLIYAVPGEDMDILKKDIDFILSLDVEHISTYSLIIEDNTILKINNIKNISEDLDFDMYKYICDRLRNNNYTHYEISNFCKEGFYSKHNSCYWNNDNYYGFGLGASSYIDNRRITNTRSMNKYLDNKYILEFDILKLDDIIEYEVILNLRMSSGINLNNFYNKYNINLIDKYDYTDLVNNKLLILKDNHLFIPEDKWYISNDIIVRLLGSVKNGL